MSQILSDKLRYAIGRRLERDLNEDLFVEQVGEPEDFRIEPTGKLGLKRIAYSDREDLLDALALCAELPRNPKMENPWDVLPVYLTILETIKNKGVQLDSAKAVDILMAQPFPEDKATWLNSLMIRAVTLAKIKDFDFHADNFFWVDNLLGYQGFKLIIVARDNDGRIDVADDRFNHYGSELFLGVDNKYIACLRGYPPYGFTDPAMPFQILDMTHFAPEILHSPLKATREIVLGEIEFEFEAGRLRVINDTDDKGQFFQTVLRC